MEKNVEECRKWRKKKMEKMENNMEKMEKVEKIYVEEKMSWTIFTSV